MGTLVGRGAELDRLLAVLDKALGGQAGALMIGGDAGIGKTRLVTEVAGRARVLGCTVLIGQCAELGDSLPYLPLADALRDPALAEALRARPVLSRLLPDTTAPEGTGGAGVGLAQQQLFGAVLGLLGELAEERPVLLAFEDLHWADRSTRDLLTFLIRVLDRERVCLLGTYRTDDLHRRHPLRPLIAELSRLPSVTALTLGPLPPNVLADHLAELGGELTAGELEAVLKRAEGNPFYAEELLDAGAGGERLPAGLTDLLLARAERVSDRAQRVLRVASVAGHRIDDDLVSTVSGLAPADYDDALREIVSHQLLVTDGDSGYMFRHALLREAVYADLLPGERTRLHGAFAALLANRPGSAAELAHHYLACHDAVGALGASVAAGREAEKLGAPAEAHQHFDQALSLWDAVPDAGTLAGMDRVRLALHSASAAAGSGEALRAAGHLRRIRDHLRSHPGSAADPTLLAEVNERMSYYSTAGDDLVAATEAADAAVALLPAEPPTPLLARSYSTYARAVLNTERSDDVVPLVERAITAAQTVDAPDAETDALVTLGLYLERYGPADALFATARERARDVGDLSAALRAIFHLARSEYERGDLAPALRTTIEGVRMAADAGLWWSQYGTDLRFLEYLINYAAGDWTRATELADGFAVRVGTTSQAVVSAYALFTDVARGDPRTDERLAWLAPLWDGDLMVAYIARGLAAEHAVWKGDAETALGHVDALVRLLPPWDPGLVRIVAVGLHACADRCGPGDGERADDLVARARTAATISPEGGRRTTLGPEGRAWLARAEAEWHRARGDDEPAMWRAVAEAFDFGFDYEVARSRWRLAASLAGHGARDEAAAEWRTAIATADRLGAAPLHAALGELGRRARFGPPAATRTGPPRLTAREREVLRLVAQGLGNREIAATLFISPKTASVHVSNILAKLGAATRTEAAAIAHRERL